MADFENLWKAIKTTGWATSLLDTPVKYHAHVS